MAEQGTGKEVTYTLDIPQREGKEGFIGTHFTLMLQIGRLLTQSDFNDTDPRLHMMTHFSISMIPGKREREEIRKELIKEIEEATKDIESNEKRGHATNMVCLRYIGSVMDFVDKHVGVSRENKIGFVMKR